MFGASRLAIPDCNQGVCILGHEDVAHVPGPLAVQVPVGGVLATLVTTDSSVGFTELVGTFRGTGNDDNVMGRLLGAYEVVDLAEEGVLGDWRTEVETSRAGDDDSELRHCVLLS